MRSAIGVRGRPALSRCADRSGDEMVIGCGSRGWCCGRSVYGGRPGCSLLAAGALRELAASIDVIAGTRAVGLGGSVDRRPRRTGWCECFVAELAQDVVGAAAEFARDREAGAVVVDPFGDLEVVGMIG
jgi:hypothetical protein